MRERENLFNEFMTDFRKHEKERLRAREEKVSYFVFPIFRRVLCVCLTHAQFLGHTKLHPKLGQG